MYFQCEDQLIPGIYCRISDLALTKNTKFIAWFQVVKTQINIVQSGKCLSYGWFTCISINSLRLFFSPTNRCSCCISSLSSRLGIFDSNRSVVDQGKNKWSHRQQLRHKEYHGAKCKWITCLKFYVKYCRTKPYKLFCSFCQASHMGIFWSLHAFRTFNKMFQFS